jgi:hypothetical protein
MEGRSFAMTTRDRPVFDDRSKIADLPWRQVRGGQKVGAKFDGSVVETIHDLWLISWDYLIAVVRLSSDDVAILEKVLIDARLVGVTAPVFQPLDGITARSSAMDLPWAMYGLHGRRAAIQLGAESRTVAELEFSAGMLVGLNGRIARGVLAFAGPFSPRESLLSACQ